MVIGFRSFPDAFAYVVLDGTQSDPKVIARDRLALPKRLTWPASLAWVRKQVGEILEKHSVEGACIKTIEPVAKQKSTERLQIEGLIQESIFTAVGVSCSVRIKSQLKRDIKGFDEPARYIDHVLVQSDALNELNSPQYQEAALAAVAELPEQ